MALVPFVFADSVGQIPLSELDVNFANVKAFALTAGNVTGNIQANITSVGTLTSLTVSGNISAPTLVGNVVGNLIGNVIGNISGNITVAGSNTQVLFNDNGLANASSGMTFNKSTNVLTISGNISSGNISTSGNVIVSGRISAVGTIATSGTIFGDAIAANAVSVTEAIIGNTVLANSGIVGVPAGVSTFFLGNSVSTTVFFAGNASNIYMANVNSFTRISGNLTANGTISASGNITGANILTSGIISLSGNLTASGNTALSGNSTAVTAANGTNTTQIATTAFVTNAITNAALPSGVILLWSGSIASIPTGWGLCNGANGTPDLRDRFVVGAGSSYAVNATGGSANAVVVSHTHTASSSVSDPGHNHANGSFNQLLQITNTQTASGVDASAGEPNLTSSGTIQSNTTGITVTTTVNSAGVSGTNANLPPYYALAYIMKL